VQIAEGKTALFLQTLVKLDVRVPSDRTTLWQ